MQNQQLKELSNQFFNSMRYKRTRVPDSLSDSLRFGVVNSGMWILSTEMIRIGFGIQISMNSELAFSSSDLIS
jgi:hypothetical protein